MGVDLLVVVLGVLALLTLCTVIGVIEGRARREAYRRLEGNPRDPPTPQRGRPDVGPGGR